jgi:hypothetical protein
MEGLDGTVMDGRTATVEVLMGLRKFKERWNILVISSLRDLDDLTSEQGDLVRETVSSFSFQGKWETGSNTQQLRTIFPDEMAQNYSYDFEAANRVHQWLRNENIPTYTATHHSAIRAAINPQIVKEAAEQGHQVAKLTFKAWVRQEILYYCTMMRKKPIPLKDFVHIWTSGAIVHDTCAGSRLERTRYQRHSRR